MLAETALMCLLTAVYYEARSEPLEGQVAVAQVIMTRVESDDYPDTVCEVVQEGGDSRRHRCQFSYYCDGKDEVMRDMRAKDRATRVAESVLFGGVRDADLIGVTHYHADYANPYWRRKVNMIPIASVGRHFFYMEI